MRKYFTRYLRFGSRVADRNGNIYKCIELSEGEELDTVCVVRYDNAYRFNVLRQWDLNSSFCRKLTDEERREMEDYKLTLPYEEIEPADEIRFIDGHYNDRFRVRNLSEVSINGNIYLAVYRDEYHTALYRKKGELEYSYGNCYHICEMGEIADRCNWVYFPCEKKEDIV